MTITVSELKKIIAKFEKSLAESPTIIQEAAQPVFQKLKKITNEGN
jgi:hypothetical protein